MKPIYCWYNWFEDYTDEDNMPASRRRRIPAEIETFPEDGGVEIIYLDDCECDGINKGSHVIVHREDITFMSEREIEVFISSMHKKKQSDTKIYFNSTFWDDQTIKADAGKPKLTLVPQQIIFDIAKVREYGVAKYGASESWKDVDIQRYRDALFRHFMAYLKEPQGVDEESGLPHIAHMACNMAFLCEMEKQSSIKED